MTTYKTQKETFRLIFRINFWLDRKYTWEQPRRAGMATLYQSLWQRDGVAKSWKNWRCQLSWMWNLNPDSCFSAKLGDTKELEDFIADLDRTLASEYLPGVKKKKIKQNHLVPLIKCSRIYQLACGRKLHRKASLDSDTGPKWLGKKFGG